MVLPHVGEGDHRCLGVAGEFELGIKTPGREVDELAVEVRIRVLDVELDGLAVHDLIEKHAHVAITQAEVDAWLRCMDKAIDRVGFDADLKEKLMQAVTRTATSVRNR